ncbi:CRISPR-associated helicase Cas3' [Ruminococcus sp. Marseille-P6503]|uniref:CRISPR-associated helicase Cas3' n=1 Tax=Ruminococcus sp. Marseille-P6503 TaxID=2364796 RepID=UPI0013DD8974|nr:CRISPR-associated helicase Cas3' [Ruminococcus sp. Marseille-P6503]
MIYAKSNPPESLEEHTRKTLDECKLLRQRYEGALSDYEWEMLYFAAESHDLGKLDKKFQNKIKGAISGKQVREESIPHGFLSCAMINKNDFINRFKDQQDKNAIFMAIMFHHDRGKFEYKSDEIEEYVADNLWENAAGYSFNGYKRPRQPYLKYITLRKPQNDNFTNRYIKIKGLLNKADYCASAGIDIEAPAEYNGSTVTQMTDRFLKTRYGSKRGLQRYAAENCDKNLIITAATGSGKTEGALLWLNGEKGFYTLPLKISINEIYRRIIAETKIGYAPCALLHSDARSYYIANRVDGGEDADTLHQKAKKLTAPLTVCTIDQLLTFAYKYNGCEMSLATLSYSKLIIDEIQSYSPRLLGTIIYALKQITELGGRFLITTATFPLLLKDFFKENRISFEMSPSFYGSCTHRHSISLLEGCEFDYERIASEGNAKKVLVIVNTVAKAQKVFEILSETASCSCRLLHSLFLAKDRKALEKDICSFAPNTGEVNGQCGIWISTQIVEASLDIDFDVLYTEMCTIDSLLQRMGRVYRSRENDAGEANVFILDSRNGTKLFIDEELYDWSLEAVKSKLGGNKCALLYECEQRDDKSEMIDYVYNENRRDSRYYNTVKEQIRFLENLSWYEEDKREVKEKLRNIDSITLCPREVYERLKKSGRLAEWREKLSVKLKNQVTDEEKRRISEEKQRVRDEILSYTVNVSYYHRLDYDRSNQLFYKHSGIYLYNGDYDFDEASSSGMGLIKAFADGKNANSSFPIDELII